jgi:uncharacterized protein
LPKNELATRRLLLTDAGPLAALVLPKDTGHLRCTAAFRRLKPSMVTTWPAFAEAMFLLGRVGGWPAQDRLWKFVVHKELTFAEIAEPLRAADLMAQYRDVPMDLADATLVALAEQDGHRRVFTLDSDFYVYRLTGGRSLEVIP